MREVFERPDNMFVDYQTEAGLSENIETIAELIFANYGDTPVDLVGHSLGGVKAIALHQAGVTTRRIVTLASPLGGSGAASMLTWVFPGSRLYKDVTPHSTVIKGLRAAPISVPVLSIVTTGGGMPVFREPNDGVVTVKSQMALTGPTYVKVDLNHFEVMLSQSVRDMTEEFLTVEEQLWKAA